MSRYKTYHVKRLNSTFFEISPKREAALISQTFFFTIKYQKQQLNKKMSKFILLLLVALLCQYINAETMDEDTYMGNFYDKMKQKCTAIGLGKKATVDGST